LMAWPFSPIRKASEVPQDLTPQIVNGPVALVGDHEIEGLDGNFRLY